MREIVTDNTGTGEFFLDRGYTGHEHLAQFSIINMNGRVYDPVLGRFLSPDNHIQAPGYTQSFNRYSYCFNNPLKYTDPSGELFGMDDISVFTVAFAIGAIWSYTQTDATFGEALKEGLRWGVLGVSYYNLAFVSLTPVGAAGFGVAGMSGLGIAGISGSGVLGMFNSSLFASIDPTIGFGEEGALGFSVEVGYRIGNFSLSGGVDFRFANKGIATSGREINFFGKAELGKFSYTMTRFGGDHSQTVGRIGLGGDGMRLYYENDGYLGDDHDRYRTAALSLNFMNDMVGVGTQMYTEEPPGGYTKDGRIGHATKDDNDQFWFPANGTDARVYVRFGNLHIAYNSNKIGHAIQNKAVHGNLGIPFFHWANEDPSLMIYYKTQNSYSHW